MTCCGRPRTTRFCPECGKRLDGSPALAELLQHCRKTEGVRRRSGTKVEQFLDENPDQERHNVGLNFLALADKWKAWGDALAAAMDKLAEE